MTLRDFTKINKKNCQLVTHYGGKKFSWPQGIAIGPSNEILIADFVNKEVITFDKDLKLIRTFGQDSKLNLPVCVAINRNIIEVSDFSDHVVKIFSLQGDYLSKFGSHGSEDGQFNYPYGLSYNSKGLLYVVEYGNCRVQVFRDNMFLFKFGSSGHSPGQFKQPNHVAVDSSDQVYVTDNTDDGGISVFSEDGHFIKKINCNSPFTICIAPNDYIITKVNNDHGLTVLSPTHKLIAKFGMNGKEKGEFNGIYGIAINNSGTIFVTEWNNHRLQIIAP